MLRVVKYAVCVKRPVPASGSFKAEERAPREVENCLRLLSFRRKINSVIGQDALHFAKIGFPAVPEVFTNVFGSSSKQHCEDCLTTLKVSWFVDILNIHFSPYMTFACQEPQRSISQLYRSGKRNKRLRTYPHAQICQSREPFAQFRPCILSCILHGRCPVPVLSVYNTPSASVSKRNF